MDNRSRSQLRVLTLLIISLMILATATAKGLSRTEGRPSFASALVQVSQADILNDTTVAVSANGLTPETVTIQMGDSVVWSNAGTTTYTLRSGVQTRIYIPVVTNDRGPGSSTHSQATTQSIGKYSIGNDFSAVLLPGQAYTHTFDSPGTVPYFVEELPGTMGVVIVRLPDTPTATPTTSLTSTATAVATHTPASTSTSTAPATSTATNTPTATSTATNTPTATSTTTDDAPPPDPSSLAPPLDRSVVSDLFTASSFLYTGPDAIQTGVVSGTIEFTRTAVLRGRVLERSGAALDNVVVSILDQPQFGHTRTRADGAFDLVVNGGGRLTVSYTKEGYLPAQRQVQTPWQDYQWLPEVVLIPLDLQVTEIDLDGMSEMAVARGSVISDTDGMRQVTVLFPVGTQAVMTLTNGTTQTLSTLNVRATEYTVGDSGREAMPADLPPNSAYTYAFELSVDEALAAGAQEVGFSQPVIVYNENFLDFPAGTIVPLGYYDAGRGLWLPADSGLVIAVLSISGGLADLDVDGSDVAADPSILAGLGISDAERARLAQLYSPGQSLWRMSIPHFSNWDANWNARCFADDCTQSNGGPPQAGSGEICPAIEQGSVIECQNQVLGERIDLVGVPFAIHYRSDRQPGFRARFTADIPLSGPSIHPRAKRIDLDVTVAGTRMTQEFPAASNQQTTFAWDGRDAYGRQVQGAQPARIQVGWVYELEYVRTERFGYSGNGIPITADRARQEFTLWKPYETCLGVLEPELAGWSLGSHHRYDPTCQMLYLGNGAKLDTSGLHPIVRTVGGNGDSSAEYIEYIATGPDGSVYRYEAPSRVVRYFPDGSKTIIAGTGVQCAPATDPCGDGGPATQARVKWIGGFAVGPDGSVYLADYGINRVRRIGPDGIITTVAGTGSVCPVGTDPCGDDGPATQATLRNLGALALGPDGSLYIGQVANNMRVRRVDPSGIISTFAGNGASCCTFGDGILATQATIAPRGIAVAPDGSVYIVAARTRSVVLRVGLDGFVSTVAGANTVNLGDGGPATQAGLDNARGIAFGPDGSLYIADLGHNRIRRVGQDGIIRTVAGNGNDCISTTSPCGDDGPAVQAAMRPMGLAVNPMGEIFVGESARNRLRVVRSVLPGVTVGDATIASQDGSEVYVFSGVGRHLRTLDALTGAVRYDFAYDAEGRLLAVTDGDGDTTTIERNDAGLPTAIVGPYGQRSELALDASGFLASVTNPAGEAVLLSSTADGLLTGMTTPRGHTYAFSYDALGRLVRDDDPAGGFKALARVQGTSVYSVTLTTALSRTSTYQVQNLPTGDQRRVDTDPAGLAHETIRGAGETRLSTNPDGTVRSASLGPDPRWSMQAPTLASASLTTPGGLALDSTEERSVVLADPNDLLSLVSLDRQRTVNGRLYTSSYLSATHRFTETSPSGRQLLTTVDDQSRPVQIETPGLLPVQFSYDERGRPTSIVQGSRVVSITYNSEGYPALVTDPLGRSASYAYDTAGRVISQTLPGGRTVGFAYDASGNLTSLTPPGRPAHSFTYTPLDLVSAYIPPDVGAGSNQTQYTYDLDRQLTQISRPDGQAIDLTYDEAGRMQNLVLPGRSLSLGYHPTSGNLDSIGVAGGVSLTYTYDGFLLTGETWSGTITGTVTGTYDIDLRVATLGVNGSNTTAFGYDADGLLTQAGGLSLSYHPQTGLLTGTSLLSVTTAYDYSGYGELVEHSAAYDGAGLHDVQFTRDDLGRITAKSEIIGGVTTVYSYTYDLVGRLTAELTDGVTVASYSYDLNGNRLSVTRPGDTTTATYDDQDRLLAYGAINYSYTANGELSTKTVGDQITTYSYDALGNLTAVELPDGTAIDYLVDGRNRRVGRLVNGALAQGWLYQDQLAPIAELDGSGNLAALFIYAIHDNVPDVMIKGGVTYRLLTDHLGSVRLVVDAATGQVAQRLDYDAFGRVLTDTNPGFQPFGFAGGLYDPLTGLVRFGARDYDAEVGRWTAKDPIGFGGGDSVLYSYVRSNPISSRDPEGLDEGATCVGATCDGPVLQLILKKVGYAEAKALTKEFAKPGSYNRVAGRVVERSIIAPKSTTASGQFVKVSGIFASMGITVLQMTDCNTVEGILSVVRQGRGGLANKNADRLYRSINKY